MNTQPSPWSWYQAALTNPAQIGSPALPVHESEPHIGYFRQKKRKPDIGWIPVAIFEKEGDLVAVVGSWAGGDRVAPETVWTWCCRYPVSHAAWKSVALEGKEWPDSVVSLITSRPDPDGSSERGVGDNSGEDEVTLFDELRDRLEETVGRALAEAGKVGKPSVSTWNDDWSVKKDRLGNYVDAISTIGKDVETAFTAEKKPFLDGGRAVDSKWRPLKEKRDDTTKKLKALIGDLLKTERDYLAEKRRQEEEAARINVPPSLDASDDAASGEAPAEAPKVKAGTTGRSIGLVRREVAKLSDPSAFAAYLLAMNPPHADVMDVLRLIANRMVFSKAHTLAPIPGVTVETEEVAR